MDAVKVSFNINATVVNASVIGKFPGKLQRILLVGLESRQLLRDAISLGVFSIGDVEIPL